MPKVAIDDRYDPKEEIRYNESPYISYFKCLEYTFDFSTIDGVCDVGCATGGLIKNVKAKYPNQIICGIEYFDWQKEAADALVKNSIMLYDIRDKLSHDTRYDIVNCTEVGEHIDEEYCPMLMGNLRKLCKKYLIMTWSHGGGKVDPEHDPHQQHLNPLPYGEYIYLVESYGFVKNYMLTRKFLEEAARCPHFYSWWRDSLIVWNV